MAIFSAVSTASDPELVKKMRFSGSGVRALIRFARSKAAGFAYWNDGAKSSVLAELVIARLRETHDGGLVDDALERIQNGMSGLKERAKNINELAESALFYALPRPLVYNEKASALLNDDTRAHLSGFRDGLSALDDWSEDTLQTVAKEFVEERDLKLGKVAQPLRAALTGTNVSPSIFEVMAVLGREESLARIDDAL